MTKKNKGVQNLTVPYAVQQIGNSLGVLISKKDIDLLGLKLGSVIDITPHLEVKQ